jgi:hypothetical protein
MTFESSLRRAHLDELDRLEVKILIGRNQGEPDDFPVRTTVEVHETQNEQEFLFINRLHGHAAVPPMVHEQPPVFDAAAIDDLERRAVVVPRVIGNSRLDLLCI